MRATVFMEFDSVESDLWDRIAPFIENRGCCTPREVPGRSGPIHPGGKIAESTQRPRRDFRERTGQKSSY